MAIEKRVKDIKEGAIPRHVAFVMDGNGRWAKEKNQPRNYGHKKGVDRVLSTIKSAGKLGIDYLTFYTFSKENWQRPTQEIDFLMDLLIANIQYQKQELIDNQVRLCIIGQKSDLPARVRESMEEVIEATKGFKRITAIFALSYSGQDDITTAAKRLAQDVMTREIEIEDINIDVFQQYLMTQDIPNPDLLIRTANELRLSNFLLWQLAYTELYFAKEGWPEFTEKVFFEAIMDYQKRIRRFGKTDDQLS